MNCRLREPECEQVLASSLGAATYIRFFDKSTLTFGVLVGNELGLGIVLFTIRFIILFVALIASGI